MLLRDADSNLRIGATLHLAAIEKKIGNLEATKSYLNEAQRLIQSDAWEFLARF